MASVDRTGRFEVGQDLRFQRYQWTVQRWGWVVLLLLMAAALLGLLGRGPLSSTNTATPDGAVRVDYDRFLRRSAPTTLTVTLGPAATDGTARVWIDREYLGKVRLQQVTPRPEREEAGPDRHTLVFRVSRPGEPAVVMLRFEPDESGLLRGRIGLGDGPEASFTQFVYP